MARRISPAFAFLFCFVLAHVFESEAKYEHVVALRRQKREWIIPPQILEENVDYTKRDFIAKIRSDKEELQGIGVTYSLKGIGADQNPFNLFVVNPETGLVRITEILDRENIAQYNLSGTAKFKDGRIAENDIGLRIKVKDQNDNPPVFGPMELAAVDELSAIGTQVMKINCKDADEPGNPNSQIKYEIVSQEPNGQQMFTVDNDGVVRVANENLDRETIDQYVVLVRASDLNGRPGGHTSTGTMTIKINDVNDNPPKLEGPFEGSIEENTQQVEVMRFKATDLDLEGTDNWVTQCNIKRGNEAGYFSIKTDPKTNEAVLMLEKAVDYEDVKDLKLDIEVGNKAPFHSSVTGSSQEITVGGGGAGGAAGASGSGGGAGASGSGGAAGAGASGDGTSGGTWLSGASGSQIPTYTVNIKVKNQPEGPKFIPGTKAITVSEDGASFDSKKIIARYPATDTDTGKEATNVRYAKGYDPDNWLSIDETTGAITMNKAPDRESKFLTNGTYYAKIFSITQDLPSKTATGTIAIQVEDFNDHCPTLTSSNQTLCTDKDAVIVTAKDGDADPNGAPFTFNIVDDGTKGKWTIEHLNDTTVIFRTHEKLWPGQYELTVEVKDQQGLSCPVPEKLTVDVCTCTSQGSCNRVSGPAARKGSTLGPAGIGLLLLGLLALLLIPLLLLLCQCGAAGFVGPFADMPYDTKEHLIAYHTEGQGEDRDVPVLTGDEHDARFGYTKIDTAGGVAAGRDMSSMANMNEAGGFVRSSFGMRDTIGTYGGAGMYDGNSMQWTAGMTEEAGGFDGMAASEQFLDEYYSQKSRAIEDGFAKNNILEYQNEGMGSLAGSVEAISIVEDDNDLAFLNDLGPKFNTLASVCGGKMTTVEQYVPPPPPPKPVERTVVSSENVGFNSSMAANTVNMASSAASSTRVENVLVTENRPTVYASVQPTTTLLVQQQQPMYYMVEQQPSTVLLAERPAMSYGQNMYVLNGGQMGEEVVLQGANVASNHGERMVLLERGGAQAVNTGVLQMGSLSGSQVLLVDGGAQSGHVLQGTLKRGVAGSQGVMVVEGGQGGVVHGSLRKGVSTHGGSQGGVYHVENRGGSGVIQGSPQKSAGSVSGKVVSSGSTQRNVTTQKVIQEKIVTSQTTM